jgi:hypothetical protein
MVAFVMWRELTCGAVVAAAIVGSACGNDMGGPGAAVTTADPATSFAPLVQLHSKEPSFPTSPRDFVDAVTLKWSSDGCSNQTIAIASKRLTLGKDPRSPLLDVERLGTGAANPYRHRPLAANCSDQRRGSFTSAQLTRPFDSRRRPAKLPAGDGFYFDLLSDAAKGDHATVRVGGQAVLRDRVPVFVESTSERVDGKPGLRLTYWMLYAHDEPPRGRYELVSAFSHEGDWERVGVLLQRAGARRYVPVSVRYSVHGRPVDVSWRAAQRATGAGTQSDSDRATHPIAFAARGTHTPYPEPGNERPRLKAPGESYLGTDRSATLPEDAPEPCPTCPQWRTWRNVLDVRRQPWYGFGGAWGYVYEGDSQSGPLGPGPLNPGAG